MSKYVVVAGRSIAGPWRGIVERRAGETNEALLASIDADRIVSEHATENEAAQSVDSWSTPVIARQAAR